ncbi:MAG: hypothetical protein A2172_00385 [Candidatus Woykebacteria bacterium RBG_13_40_15]|uniref:Uncharacterized protein n=1 Tax=Candidatus Woykebacteria bacterium RBG_13_40_15 TaxID=1802593 RepID=A0A1G1W9K5_9BACT|nr:MAG: hypothetical protein A2172_00385 [Candidatus Woykebacteria bacterium RBG_13_40_15]
MNIPFKLAYNTTVQFAGRFITAVSAAGITYLIASKFSVGNYGIYTAILSFVSLFYVFTDFGFNAIFVREVGLDSEKQKSYFKNLLGLRIVTSVLVVFIAVATLSFTDYSGLAKLGIIIGLLLIVTQSLAATALAVFQAKIRYDQALIADTFGAVANLVFVYIAVVNFSNILLVILALVTGSAVRTIVALYLARFQIGDLEISFDWIFWKKIIIPAIPIGALAIFSQFNAQIDKQIVFLAHYKASLGLEGQTAAGIYGLAYKIFEFGVALPTFIMNVGYPLMIQKKEEGEEKLLNFSKKLGILLLIIGFLGLVSGWVLSPWVFNIPGLEKFSQSVPTLRVLLIGLPLFFITPVSLWLAISINKEKEMMFIYGFVAALNLVANLFFVPSFGYNAAAVITVVSEGLILLLSFGVLWLEIKKIKT